VYNLQQLAYVKRCSQHHFLKPAAGDYHLQANSPSIDMCDNAAPIFPQQISMASLASLTVIITALLSLIWESMNLKAQHLTSVSKTSQAEIFCESTQLQEPIN
jgi:hypothetical protein